MAPDNRALAELTVKQLENWDNELQLIQQEGYEPYEASDSWRPDYISRLSISYLFKRIAGFYLKVTRRLPQDYYQLLLEAGAEITIRTVKLRERHQFSLKKIKAIAAERVIEF